MIFDTDENLIELRTSDASHGGNDMITTGAGADVVLGGFGDDVIDTSGQDGAADQVIGDNGRVTFNGTETFLPGEDEATLSFNFGAGSNDTTVTGTAGAGPARAGNWNNLQGGGETVFGDDGDEIVSFDDGSFAAGVTVRWGKDLESPG